MRLAGCCSWQNIETDFSAGRLARRRPVTASPSGRR